MTSLIELGRRRGFIGRRTNAVAVLTWTYQRSWRLVLGKHLGVFRVHVIVLVSWFELRPRLVRIRCTTGLTLMDSVHQLPSGLPERTGGHLRAGRRKPPEQEHAADNDGATVQVRLHHQSLGYTGLPVLPRRGRGRSQRACSREVTRGKAEAVCL